MLQIRGGSVYQSLEHRLDTAEQFLNLLGQGVIDFDRAHPGAQYKARRIAPLMGNYGLIHGR